MNYDKQTALTAEEIESIESKHNIKVSQIKDYPQKNVHLEVNWNLPIKITRNEDEIWFKNYKESNKENWWIVYPANYADADFRFFMEVKQFKNINDAINHGTNQYQKWLNKMLKESSKYLKQ